MVGPRGGRLDHHRAVAISPLGTALLMARLFRSEGRYQKIGPLTMLAFAVAVAGVALVALSHGGDVNFTNAPLALAGWRRARIPGQLWVQMGRRPCRRPPWRRKARQGFAGGVWSRRRICDMQPLCRSGYGTHRVRPRRASRPSSLWVALIGGPIIDASATILWRRGMLVTTSMKIQVISYFRPLLSLLWLYSLSQVGDVDVGVLFGGAVVIVIANLIAWVEGRQHPGQ